MPGQRASGRTPGAAPAASRSPAVGHNVRPRWLFRHQHPTTVRTPASYASLQAHNSATPLHRLFARLATRRAVPCRPSRGRLPPCIDDKRSLQPSPTQHRARPKAHRPSCSRSRHRWGGFEMELTNYTQTVPTNFSLNGTKVPVQSGKCHRTAPKNALLFLSHECALYIVCIRERNGGEGRAAAHCAPRVVIGGDAARPESSRSFGHSLCTRK